MHPGVNLIDLGCESSESSPYEVFQLRSVMALIRHGDRTCKQKISVKFNGEAPADWPMNTDIRASDDIRRFSEFVSTQAHACRSEMSIFRNGLRVLVGGKEDLKVKLELTDFGWLLKIKWGGTLTDLGKAQSETAGRIFRTQFSPDSSIDIKTYASADTRCKETAMSFLRGLVGPENLANYTVRSDDGPDGLGSLDDTPFRHSPLVEQIRSEIAALLMNGKQINEDLLNDLFPSNECAGSAGEIALREMANKYKSFSTAVIELRILVEEFVDILSTLDSNQTVNPNETIGLMASRWIQLKKNILRASSSSVGSKWSHSGVPLASMQISQIGDVFDNVQFDFRHNFLALNEVSSPAGDCLEKIRNVSTLLARVTTPLEYGLSEKQKSYIGATFLKPLIKKLQFDFRVCAQIPLGEDAIYLEKHEEESTIGTSQIPRSRLYFAHHSHMISFVNILKSVAEPDQFHYRNIDFLHQIDHLGYLSQIHILVSNSGAKWKLAVAVSVGDTFETRDPLEFEFTKIVEGVFTSCQEIDEFFSKILSISDMEAPALCRTGSVNNILQSIDESSAEIVG